MPSRTRPSGFSLLELLVVLVLVSILVGLAAPRLASFADGIRRRGALDRVTGDLYRARVLAVRGGEAVEVRFLPPGSACVVTYALVRARDGAELWRVRLPDEAPGVCLQLRGASTIRIDARGLPAGAARTVVARLGARSDSLRVSLVGRVFRLY